MDLVSVIIPTYNRFKYLLNAIKSVKDQTYKNIEIIIINDCSTEQEYYNFDFNKEFGDNIKIIHKDMHSKVKYGKICGGGDSRNIGMKLSNGKYIAFLDDDDYFLPTKIEKQLNILKSSDCKICCTEAIASNGPYNPINNNKNYNYNGIFWNKLINIYTKKKQIHILQNMYKDNLNIWTHNYIKIHNCTIGGSSLIMEKSLIDKAGYFPIMGKGEDREYFKKITLYSNIIYIREPLTYIDLGHGSGRNY
jgi:glycosyltransferase involved in cell wall biosynthesis